MLAGRMSGVAGDFGASTCVFAEWVLASAPMTVALAPAMKWRRRINLLVRRPGNLFQLDLDELNLCDGSTRNMAVSLAAGKPGPGSILCPRTPAGGWPFRTRTCCGTNLA
jgi:hypothetical protein